MLLKSALAQRTLCVPKFIELVLVVDHDLSLSCNRTAHDLPSSLLSIFYFIYFFFFLLFLLLFSICISLSLSFLFSLFFFISLSRGRINLDLERGSIDMALMEKKKKKKKNNSGVSWERISCQELQEGIEMSRISGTVFVPYESKRELRIYSLH